MRNSPCFEGERSCTNQGKKNPAFCCATREPLKKGGREPDANKMSWEAVCQSASEGEHGERNTSTTLGRNTQFTTQKRQEKKKNSRFHRVNV